MSYADDCLEALDRLVAVLKKRTSRNVNTEEERNLVRAIAQTWFRTYRPSFEDVLGGNTALDEIDAEMQALIKLTTGRNPRDTYKARASNARRTFKNQLFVPVTVHSLSGIGSGQETSTLRTLIASVTNPDEKEYLSEALDCLKVGGLRACVVMAWQATIMNIQNQILQYKLKEVNNEAKLLDSKARKIKTIDDFAYYKESALLEITQRLGIFDKNQKQELAKQLDLRNRCGHPGKYRPGEKKVSAFIEDIVNIVFASR